MHRQEKETVALLKSQQVIFPEWMEKAVEGLADDAMVIVERLYTPFGIYVMSIEKV
tara:strand:+ start:240 stop:407 length:168 start_codon:yes stop_codon:yes gene_type:complete